MEMNKKSRKNSGASLLELLIAVTIFLIVVGGMFACYLLIQRSWRSGDSQLKVQSQGWQALKDMSQEIMAAKEAVYKKDDEGNDDRNGIILRRPPNEEGAVVNYRFWYDANYDPDNDGEVEQVILRNIAFGPEADDDDFDDDDEEVIADQVKIEDGEYLFNIISGKNFDVYGKTTITINFKIRDARTDDGYQGIDLHTQANLRNQNNSLR